jgi:hypothetical protein
VNQKNIYIASKQHIILLTNNYPKPTNLETIKKIILLLIGLTLSSQLFAQELVQLYVHEQESEVARHENELKHFEKVAL